MKHFACMQSRRSPKSVRPRATTKVKPATKRSRRQEATPWIRAIWTTPARPMIRRQDRKNLTRGKSTLAKAPRSLTHQACTPLDTKVKEKDAWRHCPRLDEAGKAAMAQRKGQFFQGLSKGEQWDERILEWTIVDRWELWKGWKRVPDTSLGPNPVRKGIWQAEGAEVSDWSQDVWDLNGIHALTAVPSQAEFILIATSPNHTRRVSL